MEWFDGMFNFVRWEEILFINKVCKVLVVLLKLLYLLKIFLLVWMKIGS